MRRKWENVRGILTKDSKRARVTGGNEPGVVDVGRVGRHGFLKPKRRRKRNVKEIEINRGKQFTTSNDDETEEFRECLEWFHLSRTVQILSRRRRWYALSSQTIAEGEKSEMFAFDSSYARSFLTQLRCLVQRASVAHNRDVAYNLGRIGILFVLYLLFGFIYFDLDASDETGVQAMVGVIFMTSIFAGIIFMNSVMPVRVRERTVAYRERTSFMYDAIPYSLSHAFCEVPWILLVTFVTVTPLYFMVGLVPTFEHYIFHVLMVFTVSMAFMSIGQVVACLCATIQTAQAGASAFIPICFLFGCLVLAFPSNSSLLEVGLLHRPGRVRSSRRRCPAIRTPRMYRPVPER